MKQAKSSICKFCGKEKKLIGAHIIPRKFYLNYESEHYQSIDPFEGKSKTQQAGAIDKIFYATNVMEILLANLTKKDIVFYLKKYLSI